MGGISDTLGPIAQDNGIMGSDDVIIEIVLGHYSDVQAIYRFGSCTSGSARPESDTDIALLLHPLPARECPPLAFSHCRFNLEDALRQPVDLINARQVSTVLRKEIIFGDRIFCADRPATEEFEMLTLSYYQALNRERAEILASFRDTGRAYAV